MWPLIRRIWITVGLSATAVFVIWSLVAYRATTVAREAIQSDSTVVVRHDDGVWQFIPPEGASNQVLLFFPGALVDPRAYAPLARAVATEGFRAVLVELPRRAAFGGAESPELQARIDRVMNSMGPSDQVVLGGHSRGGVVASSVASRQLPHVAGLVLIGTTHPRDVNLSNLRIPVTKIVGTRDGIARPESVRENLPLLPEQTRWVWIEGGNHSQFGWYGFQPMDSRATVSAEEQRAITIRALLELMRSLAPESDSALVDLRALVAPAAGNDLVFDKTSAHIAE
ncbi:MAG TPA: alpha/beta fold hydrolase [Gemmatimonadales bacterium]|nr:alpha/beta fold hydrolase [Gemmatimonadales bacterium]